VARLNKGFNLDPVAADPFDKIFLRQDGNHYLKGIFLFPWVIGANTHGWKEGKQEKKGYREKVTAVLGHGMKKH
jgi:hypothetical protein